MKAAVIWAMCCLLMLAIPSFAQEAASTQLTLISDRDSFTLVVPDQTNLTGLKFVVAINGNQRTYELARFFSSLTLTNGVAEAGSCFRLIRNGSSSPLPGDCADRNRLFMTPVGDADVFWFDTLVGTRSTVDIWRADTRVFQCAFAESSCTFTWEAPLTPTATSPTPTITPAPSATPMPPPACATVGQIAFVSDRDGGEEIYVMNSDGRNPVRLTTNSSDEDAPDWSPDGCRIVFVSERDGNRDIYMMNADGSNQTRLTDNPNDDNSPKWSPDGTRIVFHSFRDGNAEIYVMNADGTNPTNLTLNPDGDFTPSWSPDGRQIIFTTIRDGDNEIYVMNADGSNLRRLTISALDDNEPVWSPDGSRIAFSSFRDGNWEIYVVNADGSNPINLSANSNIDIAPVWSPDSRQVFFSSNRDGNYEVYVVNADGSNLRNVTSNPKYDAAPAFFTGLANVIPVTLPASTATPTPTITPIPLTLDYLCLGTIRTNTGASVKVVKPIPQQRATPYDDAMSPGDNLEILRPATFQDQTNWYQIRYVTASGTEREGWIDADYVSPINCPQ